MTSWGASPDDWTTLDLVLGLTEDLLPVVSDPDARISPKSTLKALGKTPSHYNGHDLVVGIPKWTEHRATSGEVEQWAADSRLGACLQTRRVRAIDIDVPDEKLSAAIVAFIAEQLGIALPRRFRKGSGKCLLAFEMPGDYRKGVMKVEGGILEFLAGGNQFVVTGAHFGREGPSGTRYAWEGGLPTVIPTLSPEQFETLWAALEAAWALEPSTRLRAVSKGADLGLEDAEASWLVENWESYGLDREGRRLFVLCPWKAGHSIDSGETEAAWLLRGTGGFAMGHFNCQHGTCKEKGHSRSDFLREVGYDLAAFDVVGGVSAERGQDAGDEPAGVLGRSELSLPLPGFRRNKVTGVILATLNNLIRACQYVEVCRCELAFDTFRDELLIGHGESWRPFKDTDTTEIRRVLGTRDFEEIPKEAMRDAIRYVAEQNRFDAAVRWLEGLPVWDGVERCARFLPEYMGTADTPYSRAVGLYAWTAHAGRVMDPGCKVDMVIALTGAQGQNKSGAIAAIAPDAEFYTELSLHKIDDNLARKMRGVLVAEISELRGLNSTDAESIRAWITQRQEKWTPKFVEHATIFLRRLVLWSTTNEEEFLGDPTGERRWLPNEVERDCSPDMVERDRDQLWAEGLARWRSDGVAWSDAMRLAKLEHTRFKVGDPWSDRIADWLDEPDLAGITPRSGNGFKIETVAIQVLGLDFARFGRREEMRISKILKAFGLKRGVKRVEGRTCRLWFTDL